MQTVTLLGAETVENASIRMSNAAETMRAAFSNSSYENERLIRALEEHSQTMRAYMDFVETDRKNYNEARQNRETNPKIT